MIVTDTPLREKLVLLMSEQFPTSYEKVGYADLMYNQNELFRTLGPGSFETLTQAVAQDPAMLIWLDTGMDYKAHPNENFARELMERFTMGVGTYSERDVRESARAFTGWTLDYTTGEFFFNQYDHDNGEKRFLGHAGRFQARTSSTSSPTRSTPRTSSSRGFCQLARLPRDRQGPRRPRACPRVQEGPQHDEPARGDLPSPAFVSSRSMNGLIKQPIEYLVGTLRLLGLTTQAFEQGDLVWLLSNLGQQPFMPFNVGGWGQNQYWLSTSASNSQLSLPANVAQYADLTEVADMNGNPGAQVDAITKMLAIDAWSNQSYRALWKIADQGGRPGAVDAGPGLSRVPPQLIGALMSRSFTRRDFLGGSLGVGAVGAVWPATLGPGPSLARFGTRARRPRRTQTTAATAKPLAPESGPSFFAPCTGATTASTPSCPTRAASTSRCGRGWRSPRTRRCP